MVISTDGPGGAERVFSILCNGLPDHGIQVTAFLPANEEGWLEQQIDTEKATVVHYPCRISAGSKYLADTIRPLINQHEIDLMHCHMPTAALSGGSAAQSLHIPYLVTLHGFEHTNFDTAGMRAFLEACVSAASVVGVCKEIALNIRSTAYVAGNLHTIPNGILPIPKVESSLRSELGLRDEPLVVNVGNLYPVKNHATLLHALSQIRNLPEPPHLAIAGRGELLPDLLRQTKDLGLENRVHWLGLRSDIANILAAADVFVLSSLSEGLPMALLEAMTASVPVVATDTGGIREALGDGHCGLLVRPNDSFGLARSLHKLMSDRPTARGLAERAQRRAREQYQAHQMISAYASMYQRIGRSSSSE